MIIIFTENTITNQLLSVNETAEYWIGFYQNLTDSAWLWVDDTPVNSADTDWFAGSIMSCTYCNDFICSVTRCFIAIVVILFC